MLKYICFLKEYDKDGNNGHVLLICLVYTWLKRDHANVATINWNTFFVFPHFRFVALVVLHRTAMPQDIEQQIVPRFCRIHTVSQGRSLQKQA